MQPANISHPDHFIHTDSHPAQTEKQKKKNAAPTARNIVAFVALSSVSIEHKKYKTFWEFYIEPYPTYTRH
jgi:hypothetical protein